MILASCICQSRSFISASILSIEKVKGVLALIVEAMKGDVPAHFFFSFPFSGLLIFVFIFSWLRNTVYQIPKTGVVFCTHSH